MNQYKKCGKQRNMRIKSENSQNKISLNNDHKIEIL